MNGAVDVVASQRIRYINSSYARFFHSICSAHTFHSTSSSSFSFFHFSPPDAMRLGVLYVCDAAFPLNTKSAFRLRMDVLCRAVRRQQHRTERRLTRKASYMNIIYTWIYVYIMHIYYMIILVLWLLSSLFWLLLLLLYRETRFCWCSRASVLRNNA